jgi:hypothetical protein
MTQFWSENLNGTDNLKDTGIHRRILCKWISKKEVGRV